MNICLTCKYSDKYYYSRVFAGGYKLHRPRYTRQLIHILYICRRCLLTKEPDLHRAKGLLRKTLCDRTTLLRQLTHSFHGKQAKVILLRKYLRQCNSDLMDRNIIRVITSYLVPPDSRGAGGLGG